MQGENLLDVIQAGQAVAELVEVASEAGSDGLGAASLAADVANGSQAASAPGGYTANSEVSDDIGSSGYVPVHTEGISDPVGGDPYQPKVGINYYAEPTHTTSGFTTTDDFVSSTQDSLSSLGPQSQSSGSAVLVQANSESSNTPVLAQNNVSLDAYIQSNKDTVNPDKGSDIQEWIFKVNSKN